MPGESPQSMMRPPDQEGPKASVARGRRRRWPILAPAVLVIALAIAWTWLWYYAASVADRTLAGWVEREAAAGRIYSCGSQSIGGFPLRIEARCDDVAAEIRNAEPPYAARAKAATFAAELWHPTSLVGNVRGPLSLAKLGEAPGWVADWTRARLTVHGVAPNPEAISAELDEPHVDRAGAAANGDIIFKAKHAGFQGRLTAGSPRDHPVIALTLRFSGATAPLLHPLLGAPIDCEINAVIHGFADLSPKPWAERFREMHAANGAIEIKSLRLARTNSIVAGAGTLSVNANGKLEGLMHVAIVGLDRLVPLLGIDRLISQGIDRLAGSDGSAAQAASALDRLIPGLSVAIRDSAISGLIDNLKKMGQPSTVDNQAAISLPLRLVDGSVYLGMLRVGEVPALF